MSDLDDFLGIVGTETPMGPVETRDLALELWKNRGDPIETVSCDDPYSIG